MRRLVLALLLVAVTPTPALAALERREFTFVTSDGTPLHGFVEGEAPLATRPAVVEFSPYAPASARHRPGLNAVEVHVRGTGRSGGAWDIAGPREQQDAHELLAWACAQPWSAGSFGLYGESAPAISAYNALRRPLPCVKAAALWSGTTDLYRDIAYIGGVPNAVVSGGFSAQVAAPAAQNLQGRPQDPQSHAALAAGFAGRAADYLSHPTLDAFWTERAFTSRKHPPADDVPILANTGLYDISTPASFAAFRETRSRGSQLRVLGAHDRGFPGAAAQWVAESNRWFDHHLRGVDNGIDREEPVQLWVPDCGLSRIHAGSVERVAGTDWPLPGTHWRSLYLDPAPSGSADSLNDGTLGEARPAAESVAAYPFAPSNPVATDPSTTAGLGLGTTLAPVPTGGALEDAERTGLTFTTEPLPDDVLAVGPAAIEVSMASTAPETDIHVLLSDVDPAGLPHPIAVGRLRTGFPAIDDARSLRSAAGDVVAPYADFSRKDLALPGEARRYRVGLWPVGNRFRAGHRIRLTITGTPATGLPSAPAVNSVTLGGPDAARLLLPEVGR